MCSVTRSNRIENECVLRKKFRIEGQERKIGMVWTCREKTNNDGIVKDIGETLSEGIWGKE